MNLENIGLLSLQTTQMKQDPTTKAMCNALNPKFTELATEKKKVLIYSQIDSLEESILDELAIQMKIDWYDLYADIETKREVIKTAGIVHKARGTAYAVEKVVQAYFPDSKLEEWFEYDGDPYKFRIVTTNRIQDEKSWNKLISNVYITKNKRSWVDTLILQRENNSSVYMSSTLHSAQKLQISTQLINSGNKGSITFGGIVKIRSKIIVTT